MALLLAPFAGFAQQRAAIAKIGVIIPTNATATAHVLQAFREGLLERGYVEGKNFTLVPRYGESRVDRVAGLARELSDLKVDVILTVTDGAIAAAAAQARSIPIVMAISSDPIGIGAVRSLARPGGNVTGLTSMSPELNSKRLQILREVAPGITRVAWIWNPLVAGANPNTPEIEKTSRDLGLRVRPIELRRPQDVDRVFDVITKEHLEALVVPEGNVPLFANRDRVVAFAQTTKLPSIYGQREYASAGGLIAYGPSTRELFRRAAVFVDKILRGANPADLPVEQPTKFELAVNLRTARLLGLSIPQSILVRADALID